MLGIVVTDTCSALLCAGSLAVALPALCIPSMHDEGQGSPKTEPCQQILRQIENNNLLVTILVLAELNFCTFECLFQRKQDINFPRNPSRKCDGYFSVFLRLLHRIINNLTETKQIHSQSLFLRLLPYQNRPIMNFFFMIFDVVAQMDVQIKDN